MQSGCVCTIGRSTKESDFSHQVAELVPEHWKPCSVGRPDRTILVTLCARHLPDAFAALIPELKIEKRFSYLNKYLCTDNPITVPPPCRKHPKSLGRE
jgi:hypothetical protein